MPGTASPQHGIQAFWAMLDELRARVQSLETWQRQTRGIPAGTITRWGGVTAPAGALVCDGSTFSSARYPALYAALGTTTLPSIAGTPIYIIWT